MKINSDEEYKLAIAYLNILLMKYASKDITDIQLKDMWDITSALAEYTGVIAASGCSLQ